MKETRDALADPVSGLVLGIETATALGGVAVASPAGILGEITLLSAGSHSERILPAANHLLSILGVPLAGLAAVAVSIGPGSFTGLRTGVAAAKGLSFSLGVPLYGVPTLEALAANAGPREEPVCAVLCARRGEVFRALYRVGRGAPEPLLPEAAVPVECFAEELPPGCLVVGDPPAALREPGAAGLRGLRLAPAHLNHPRAAVTALLGLDLLRAGAPSALRTLRPRYLRPSDAETGLRAAPR